MKYRKANWTGGQLLAFSGVDGQSDFMKGLVGRTSFTGTAIEIKLPCSGIIRFSDTAPLQASFTGDYFVLELNEGAVKGAIIDAYHILVAGACQVEGDELAVAVDGSKTLIGVKEFFSADKLQLDLDGVIDERSRWLQSIDLPKGIDERMTAPLLKALSVMKTQILAPEGKMPRMWTTPDRWPHRGMWLWDSVFHAIGLRHIDPQIARDAIDSVLDMQREDGFIPHQMSPEYMSDITQPPVLALGIKLVNEVLKDQNWISTVYPKLKAYLAWNVRNRDTNGNGLLEWFIEANEKCRSGESGMDNSPRFDAATQLDAVDFNAFMALEYQVLAEFAEQLGKADEVREFRGKHETMCHLLNEYCWNEDAGFYVDFDVDSSQQCSMMASSGFLPLICGAATERQAELLVGHLHNPETFGTTFPVPSIAVRSLVDEGQDMWRGPVWININWLIAYGLKEYGYGKEADALLQRTMDELVKQFEAYGTFFEFFDYACEIDPPKLLRKRENAPEKSPYHQVLFDYGWSATLFVDMLYCRKGQLGGIPCSVTAQIND